jgi:ribosomal protein S27E
VRSDRDLTNLGKIADLVPTAPPLVVGDSGSIAGKSFEVMGRLQLDHGRGPWDEWYIAFSDGQWAWLARAQGQWYLTFERDGAGLPTWDAMSPGSRGVLAGTGSIEWVVAERGGSALISAEGELPFAAVPLSSGRYVDLSSEGHGFATLDYGDGSEPPKLFAGRVLAPNELALKKTALGPRATERVAVEKLSCPTCGNPVPIFVPETTERCACAACGALLDPTQGNLRLLAQLDPPNIRPYLPLGSEGELLGAKRLVVGFMQRYVDIEGERFRWREYLLHGEGGYTWLVEDNRHFVHVAPVGLASVKESYAVASYQGRTYKRFAAGSPVVEHVIGEFYWRVKVGDSSRTIDFVAPPRILSREESDGEINWSEGEYVDSKALFKAFGVKTRPPEPIGVAPCQPNPHSPTLPAIVFAILAVLLLLVASVHELGRETRIVHEAALALPPSEAAINAGLAERPPVTFLPAFDISRAPTTLSVELETNLANGWVHVGTALLNETSDTLEELDIMAEHYQGVTDGESWSEGDTSSTEYYGRLKPGRHVLRVAPSWDAYPESAAAIAPQATLRITEGARSPLCCCGAFLLITLPFLFSLVRRAAFEAKRRENANP